MLLSDCKAFSLGQLQVVPSQVQLSPQVQFSQVHFGFEQFFIISFLYLITCLLYTHTGYM